MSFPPLAVDKNQRDFMQEWLALKDAWVEDVSYPTDIKLILEEPVVKKNLKKALEALESQQVPSTRCSVNSYLRARFVHRHKNKRLRAHRKGPDRIFGERLFKNCFPTGIGVVTSDSDSLTIDHSIEFTQYGESPAI